jgi:hypothetical protein
VLSRCAIVSTVAVANSARTVRWRRDTDGQWSSGAPRQSVAIGSHRRPSEAISGHQYVHTPG